MKASIKPLTIILVGPSGSGKGTQASLLVDKFGFEYIEMGRIIRKEAKKDTELGRKIKKIVMGQGKLIPDEVSYDLLKDKVLSVPKNKNLIIDGYPRTLKQVKDLDEILKGISRNNVVVFNINIPDEVAIERLSARLLCDSCKNNFKENELKIGSTCPRCGGKLIKRPDDTPEKVKQRLDWAHKKVKRVIDEYKRRSILFDINGNQAPEDVFSDITKRLKL